MKEKTKGGSLAKIAAAAIIVFILAALLLPEIKALGADLEKRRSDSVYDAVLRAAFQCYAVEGVYPDSLSYLEDTYGLLINHEKYIVSYDCYASNRPPKVQVLKR